MTQAPRFAMLRSFHLADLITLVNGICGTLSVFSCLKYLVTSDLTYLRAVFWLLPVAIVADVLDGRVARALNAQSLLGQELDSLADLLSFGMAPAVLAFTVGMRGGWDAVILAYFVTCGLSRLARYNATAASLSDDSGTVKYFEGTPIPTSLVLVTILGVLVHKDLFGATLPFGAIELFGYTLHPLTLMYAASGSAMISKSLHVPKP